MSGAGHPGFSGGASVGRQAWGVPAALRVAGGREVLPRARAGLGRVPREGGWCWPPVRMRGPGPALPTPTPDGAAPARLSHMRLEPLRSHRTPSPSQVHAAWQLHPQRCWAPAV